MFKIDFQSFWYKEFIKNNEKVGNNYLMFIKSDCNLFTETMKTKLAKYWAVVVVIRKLFVMLNHSHWDDKGVSLCVVEE